MNAVEWPHQLSLHDEPVAIPGFPLLQLADVPHGLGHLAVSETEREPFGLLGKALKTGPLGPGDLG